MFRFAFRMTGFWGEERWSVAAAFENDRKRKWSLFIDAWEGEAHHTWATSPLCTEMCGPDPSSGCSHCSSQGCCCLQHELAALQQAEHAQGQHCQAQRRWSSYEHIPTSRTDTGKSPGHQELSAPAAGWDLHPPRWAALWVWAPWCLP